jgi:hypothetical protein
MGLEGSFRPQHLVFERRGYGAMAIIVKTFFAVFSVKNTLIYQQDSRLSAEIA